jgi:hypothetical protein
MRNTSIFIILFLTATTVALGQSSNENLNRQVQEMKKLFLAEDYRTFSNYTYPKVIEMFGGKEEMIQATKNGIDQMKKEGYQIVDITYKDASKLLTQDQELQCSLTQELLMQMPQGKLLAEYTLIAISADKGKNWKFLDTSGKSKEVMIKYFPNLHPDLVIKPKSHTYLE